MLEENYADETWINSVKKVANPFGDGRAAHRIVKIIENKTGAKQMRAKAASKENCSNLS